MTCTVFFMATAKKKSPPRGKWPTFAALILDRRQAADMTLAEVAQRCGTTRQNVWNWEAGVSMCQVPQVRCIAECLKVRPLDVLLACEGTAKERK